MIGMGKDMGIKYAGSQEALHVFNCALELLASPALESKQELLELVKKAKCDADKYHPPAPTAVKKPSHKSRSCGSHGLSIFRTLTEPRGCGRQSWKWPTGLDLEVREEHQIRQQ